eukprot:CAMPEP_0169299294 /NCGR_PEP_ID=MMETSP1016-20121227/66975_1 /TAXON_ID=342587 /ORGANISM="Karlodinium micrum, Strain CCMP2283" /LENGTH=298 /DNA_ID=CAMNT_0009391499 /DNA_START=24 /DNA_END=920 /DNA_ORIENTATION=+
MTVDVGRSISPVLADEILRRYADVLRVGRLILNGSEVCWSTVGSTASQLQAFSAVFCKSLRPLKETRDLDDKVLCQAVYWFCKVVSINYALSDVLDVVKAKLGEGCSIMTTDPSGRSLVEYNVEVSPELQMHVNLSWRQKGNIVFCDPKTAKKKVKGTLSSLATTFPLPPEHSFAPTYKLLLKEKRSRKQKMVSKVSSLVMRRKQHCRDSSILVDSPLAACKPIAPTSCSTETPSEFSGDSNISLPSLQRVDSECSSSIGVVSDRLAASLMQVNEQLSIGVPSNKNLGSEVHWREMML